MHSGTSGCRTAVLFLFLALTLASCNGKRTPSSDLSASGPADQATVVSTGARRADPGYIQYLERLSMLGSQTELARVVSGSQLAWLKPAESPFPEPLLTLADSWLLINPLTFLSEPKKTAFTTLGSPIYWQIVSKARLGGVYFAPVSGAGGLWAYNRKASPRGDDVIQYTFSEAAGEEGDYFRLLNTANTNRKLLGMDLVPASTGLGPDFFLAARYHRQFSGIYCMVELPGALWPAMPQVTDQWRGEPLEERHIAVLHQNNLLPPGMVQDAFPLDKRGGWAITGEIHGVDGLARRWVYRYYETPDRPVLNWEDPSAGARKIVSGSAIRSVGMMGGALVGMRMEGLYGLDAAEPGGQGRFSLLPGTEAAVSVSREVRRYGGWSWLQDELPLSAVQAMMASGPDFFQDTVFSPGIEHSLLTGNTELLKAMVDDAMVLGLDMRRFVRTTPAERGVSYALPHLAEIASDTAGTSVLSPKAAADLRRSVQAESQNAVYASTLSSSRGEDVPPLGNKHLSVTTAGLAALALGSGNAESVSREMASTVSDGAFLQVFLRAMLPGLLMVSGQDIAGTLPLSWYAVSDSSANWDTAQASRGAYALTQSIMDTAVTAQGVPKAKAVHPTADVQIMNEDSFIGRLADALAMRSALSLAHGTLHGRFATSPGSLAVAVILPHGQDHSSTASADRASLALPPLPDEEAVLIAPPNRKLNLAERRLKEHRDNERRRASIERRLIAAPRTGSVTPSGGDAAVIAIVNFSRDTVKEVLNVDSDPLLQSIRSKGDPRLLVTTRGKGADSGIEMSFGPKTVTLTLPPWHGAAVLIGRAPE